MLAAGAIGAGAWYGMGYVPTYAKQSSDNVVIQWNNAAIQAIGATATGPTVGARALAIAHTCMFDAWTAYDTVAVPTRSNGIPRHSGASNGLGNKNQAISYAAYRALLDLFPSQSSTFTALMTNLGYNPNYTSSDTSSPTGVGNVAAQAVLTYRHTDGSNQLGDLHPGAYSDYTGYAPVNTPDTINDPNRWQPLRAANGTVQQFLTPHWGKVAPFSLSSGSQFRPAGPATVGQAAYQAQADAILQLSAGLNDTSKVIAEYWADGPRSATPPGHWDLLSQFASAQFLSHRNKNDPNADVQLFFTLSNAIFDASIAVWECKRFYDSIRPVSAVHYLYSGKSVTAWGGPGKGTQTFDGSLFKSYIATPGFAEYVSGHSTFSATGATILKLATGSDTFGDSYSAPAGSSTIEPNITPASPV